MSYTTRAHLQHLAAAVLGIFVGLLLAGATADALGGAPPIDPVVASDYGERQAAAVASLPARTAPPSHAAPDDDTIDVTADAAWYSLRRGYVGIALLLLIHFGGAHLYKTRGAIVKRWPRLDVGRAWSVVAIAVSSSATLIPLAVTGDLTQAVLLAQVGAASALLVQSKLGAQVPVDETPPT